MIDLFLTLMITLFSGDVPTETIHVENQAATTEQMAPVDTGGETPQLPKK